MRGVVTSLMIHVWTAPGVMNGHILESQLALELDGRWTS